MNIIVAFKRGEDSIFYVEISDVKNEAHAMQFRDACEKVFNNNDFCKARVLWSECKKLGGTIQKIQCDCHYPSFNTQQEEFDYMMKISSRFKVFFNDNGVWINDYKNKN